MVKLLQVIVILLMIFYGSDLWEFITQPVVLIIAGMGAALYTAIHNGVT